MLRVVHEGGDLETIFIKPPAKMSRGKVLNKILTSDGTEYFFTREGYYDGWGQKIGQSAVKSE